MKKLWSRLLARRRARGLGESDAPADLGVAASRPVGGDAEARGDASSTTGSGRNEEFVGRVAGQDVGYAGCTGAEARAEAAARENGSRAGQPEDSTNRD